MAWWCFGRGRNERASQAGFEAIAAEMALVAAEARFEERIDQRIHAATGGAPTYPLSDSQLWEHLFGAPEGVVTAQTARAQHVVYTCVSLISGSIAPMPIEPYKVAGKRRELDESSPLLPIFDDPCPRYSRVTFWRSVISDMLLNGNGIAWIERRGAVPIALWFIPWGRTGIYFYKAPSGQHRLRYHLVMDDGRHIEADQDDVLHFPGSPFWDIFYSVSPLTAYARTIGIAINAEKFAEAYFKNGSQPDGVITLTNVLKKPDDADEYRRRFMARFAGDQRFMGPAVLDGGAKYERIGINAVDAQLIETRQLSALEIARGFHVPPHLINLFDKVQAFGKGLEELNQGFVTYALNPHIASIEVELKRKLSRRGAGLEFRFNREEMLRGDLKSRFEAFQMSVGGAQGPGWRSVDEVRQLDGLAPLGAPYDKPLQWGAPRPDRPENGAAKSDPAQPQS